MKRVRFRPWKCPDCGMTERKEPHRRLAHHMEAAHGKRWSDERGEYVLMDKKEAEKFPVDTGSEDR